MVYNDIEMVILSQLAYQDMREGETLWSALLNNQGYLEDSLGADYKTHISGLISKVKDNGCYIAKASKNTSSGFSAFAVEDPINNNVIVACRGTELGKISENPITTGKDLYEDVSLALANQTNQQQDMANFMSDLQQGGYDKYSFTGHSLGGNLAMYGAITLNDKSKLKECKTFNAPGFNEEFHKKYKNEIDAVEKRITSYQNKYDGVSEALKVPGKKVILASKKKWIDGGVCHLQDDFVISGNGFQKAKPQKKSITILGSALKIGGFVIENPETMGSISRFNSYSTDISAEGPSSSVGVIGSKKIELTPAELKGQASQMLDLGNEYENLFDHVVSDLNSVNRNWSPNLAHNFTGKITSTQGKFKHISDMLATGSAVANIAANNFESTDSLLAKIMISDSSKQDNGSIVGAVKGSVGKTSGTI